MNKIRDLIFNIEDLEDSVIDKVTEGLEEEGCKIISKDGNPVCYVVQPEMFEEMVLTLDAYENMSFDEPLKEDDSESFRS